MTTHRTQNSSAIGFTPPALYPPDEKGTTYAFMSASSPGTERRDFEYLVNGTPGPFEGIRVEMAGPFGVVIVDENFRQNLKPVWPARLEVRALQNGVPVSTGVLELLDVRQATPVRMQVRASPTLQLKPPPYLAFSTIEALLFDANDIPLPLDPTGWTLHLDDPPHGVTLYGRDKLMAQSDAPPGPVRVRVVAAGFEETVTIQLLAAATATTDGLQCDPRALYAPASGNEGAMIRGKAPESTLDFTLNGAESGAEGITLTTHLDISFIVIDDRFLAHYTGPWPAVIEVRERRGDIVVDRTRLRLLDPGSAEVAHIKMALKPRQVTIGSAADWSATCWVGVSLFDRNNVALPRPWPAWDIRLPDAPQGVSVVDNHLHITHTAQPGDVTVVALMANGVQGTTTLHLV